MANCDRDCCSLLSWTCMVLVFVGSGEMVLAMFLLVSAFASAHGIALRLSLLLILELMFMEGVVSVVSKV